MIVGLCQGRKTAFICLFSEAQAVKWLVTTVAVETCSYFKANLKTFNVIN